MNETLPNPSDREQRLQAVLADFIQALEAGRTPDRRKLLGEHPDLADDLASFFANRAEFAQLAWPVAPPAAEAATLGVDGPTNGLPTIGNRMRYFGDYEIIEEIARGGMGVVFKARQVSLNRMVALKMILAGQLATPLDVQRFHHEAEAAANLDHPHIVPIYEVNEYGGSHYFSMKLIEGDSLSDHVEELRENRRRGVQLMTLAARAVHYAHQRGILHRDLKPANILIDKAGHPHVTDFGLAKKVIGDGGMTQSGAIVGTPGYMAPEQAAAKKDLTTAVDVYGLGAVLYELLTGRPPFRGATTFDTISQVLEQEPEPPRRRDPSVPRDLELIVLKCLAKVPGKRYESAAALADDLEHWLNHEPIAARPARLRERLFLYARRNPGLVILTVAFWFAIMFSVFPVYGRGAGNWLFSGVYGALFIAWMIRLALSNVRKVEQRLRLDRPAVDPPITAIHAAPGAGLLRRKDLAWSLAKGAVNGAVISLGLALSCVLLPLQISPPLKPVLLWGLVVLAVQTGALAATATRLTVKPLGRLPWFSAFVAGAFLLPMGSADWWIMRHWDKPWYLWGLAAAPLLAVTWDMSQRHVLHVARRQERSGELAPEKVRLIEGHMPDLAVKCLPTALAAGGTIAGDWPGRAAGKALAVAAYSGFGMEFGGLIGRLLGMLCGAVLAMVVLRFYRVEAGRPWPGQADRPYPVGLAAIEIIVGGLFAVFLLSMR